MSASFPLTVSIVVQWSEMDALGHVNNARFFTWFESARIAMFQRIGVATSGLSAIGPILATTTCDFLRTVVYPATVRVGVTTCAPPSPCSDSGFAAHAALSCARVMRREGAAQRARRDLDGAYGLTRFTTARTSSSVMMWSWLFAVLRISATSVSSAAIFRCASQ